MTGMAILLLALGDHPYGYYQFLRWAIMIIAGYSAYLSHEEKNTAWVWIFSLMAVLFNPIIPLTFAKEIWQIIDVIVAIILAVNIIKTKK